MTYTIITRSVPPCAYCDKAKALLDSKGIAYTEYDLSANEGSIELFKILGYKRYRLSRKVIGRLAGMMILLNT